tara:strand:- start:21732 stop:21983 length:252 start_codon:yes stop_codon:yes gene_type:complete
MKIDINTAADIFLNIKNDLKYLIKLTKIAKYEGRMSFLDSSLIKNQHDDGGNFLSFPIQSNLDTCLNDFLIKVAENPSVPKGK